MYALLYGERVKNRMTAVNKMMDFNTLVSECALTVKARGGDGNPVVSDIAYDSRKCKNGAVYCALTGTKTDGNKFIGKAVENGAVAVITENRPENCSIPWVQVTALRKNIGLLGKKLWNLAPDKTLFVGITGTNGKTTVAHLYADLLRNVYGRKSVWMFGTIDFSIGETTTDATHTTPEALEVFRYMHNEEHLPEAVVMEVSSHSLALDRVGGLKFDMVIFTNLTQDHLDFHNDMESYYSAKKKLFTEYLKPEGIAVINCDDPFGERLAGEIKNVTTVTFGKNSKADYRIASSESNWRGCTVELESENGNHTFFTGLCGGFNVYNMTACIVGGLQMTHSEAVIEKSMKDIATVNGRMERVDTDEPFTIVIDYAHTPDALMNVLRTAREITKARLFCVFGCGGDRDKKKRPLMGEAVAVFCDEAWVTSDNPRSENPNTIINQIIDGIPLDFPHQIQVDRKKAIAAALAVMKRDDCLVIAGKGHETYQEINGIRHHFDDKETVLELLQNRIKPGVTENDM